MVEVSSIQKDRNERKHVHLSSCTYRAEASGDGVSTGTKRSSRRIEMMEIRVISGSSGVNELTAVKQS